MGSNCRYGEIKDYALTNILLETIPYSLSYGVGVTVVAGVGDTAVPGGGGTFT